MSIWTSPVPINLLRYLLVWRVNSTLAQIPPCLSVDLSRTLGALIASRLPTRQAAPWRKALARWDNPADVPAEAPWPIHAAIFPYPFRRTYGQSEPIMWELKLFGACADHGFFLETILPAIEAAGYTADAPWCGPYKLWGRFDIQAIYVARGARWEPLVSDGRLDLRLRPTTVQWAEGFQPSPESKRALTRLTWITPFDMDGIASGMPSMNEIVYALAVRLHALLPGRRESPEAVWDALVPKGQPHPCETLPDSDNLIPNRSLLTPAPKSCPGRWLGTQTFESIPVALLPYLELASILHMGNHTHFGCGTFILT